MHNWPFALRAARAGWKEGSALSCREEKEADGARVEGVGDANAHAAFRPFEGDRGQNAGGAFSGGLLDSSADTT